MPQTCKLSDFHLDLSTHPGLHQEIQCFRQLPNRPKIGLALGGGGARGLAHVGVLLALAQLQLPVDFVAGTSAGAIAGAALAAGIPPQELLDIAFDSSWWFMIKPSVFERRGGVLSSAGIERWLTGWLGYVSFSDLQIPLTAVATDLRNGNMFLLNSGKVAKAARISSTVPGLYAPVEWEGRLLADGGMVCNLPVPVVKEMGADIVIAVDLNSRLSRGPLRTFTEVITQAILIVQRANELSCRKEADLLIEPDLGDHTLVDFEAVRPMVEKGVQAVAAKLPEIAKLLRDVRLTLTRPS